MLAETSARQWLDAQLNQWINDGVKDIVRKTETLQATSTISTTGGTQAYVFAPTPQPTRFHRAEWNATGDSVTYPLEYRDFSTLDEVWGTSQKITQGIPQYWTLWGTPGVALTVTLYPTPSAATGTLKLFYYRLPTVAVSDGDVLELPEGWDDLIVSYAEYNALRRDRDQRWQEAFQIYQEKLGDMIDLIGGRYSDQAGTFVRAGAVPYGMPWLLDY